VLFLGFVSGLPYGVVTSIIYAWFMNRSVAFIAFLTFITMPYTIQVFFAPIVDKYNILSFGKRRGWLLLSQFMIILCLLGLALSAKYNASHVILILSIILATFSALQDVVVNAHRIEYLDPQEFALGASLFSTGYRLALIFSGGLGLIIADKYSFSLAFALIAILVCASLILVYLSHEPKNYSNTGGILSTYFQPCLELYNRPYFKYLLGFILTYVLTFVFTSSIGSVSMAFLVQHLHFSLTEVAVANKTVGILALVCGGLVSGAVLMRISLYKALTIFGIMQALSNTLFILLTYVSKSVFLLSCLVFCDNFVIGLTSTSLVALLMKVVDKRFTATQFALLIVIVNFEKMLAMPVAAFIEQIFSWRVLYSLAFVLSFLFIPFLKKLKRVI
jgi:MFS transporter, PAT family, beta-lactamase induction signal transducer AmpG